MPIIGLNHSFTKKVDRMTIVGISHVEHWFDLSATSRRGELIVMDIVISNTIANEIPVLATYAKVFDTSPSKTFLVLVPGATDAARRLSQAYNMILIEGISADEIVAKFEKQFALNSV